MILFAGFVLGPLSVNEQVRLSINFSLSACHLAMVLTSIYFGSLLLSSEIRQKTALVLFTKPLSYSTYIAGKFLSLSMVLGYILVCLVAVAMAVHWFYSYQIVGFTLFIAFYGIWLECLVLVAIAFYLSGVTSPFLTMVYSFLIFMIGHSVSSMVFFIEYMEKGFLKTVTLMITYLLPNFEKLNWRSQALYQDFVSVTDVLTASVYSFAYMVFVLCCVYIVFRRTDIA